MNLIYRKPGVLDRLFAGLTVLALVVTLMPTAPVAYADEPVKTFTASVAPSSLSFNGSGTFTFTINNTSGTGGAEIKSFKIVLPTGFNASGLSITKSGWSIGLNGSNIEASDSASPDWINPGESTQVTATLTHSGAGSGATNWNVCAYKNNSFNPGGGAQFDIGTGMTAGVCGLNVQITVNVPPTDVCTNLDGLQTVVPDGYTADGTTCTLIVVTDVCPNIDGAQATIPDGLVVNDAGNCVTPPTDVCTNLDGLQTVVPDGYTADGTTCTLIVVTDVCPNIDGAQATIPDGLVVNDAGNCVESTQPTDVCPNIDGNQSTVPEGLVKDDAGNCVESTQPTDVCPNIDGNQSVVPEGLVKDDSGNCVESVQACSITVVSDTTNTIVEKSAANAVLAWTHPLWTAIVNGASWIWGENPVADASVETTYTFVKTFNWNGPVTNASIKIATDDWYTATLNGVAIGSDNSPSASYSEATADTYDVTTGYVQTGSNELRIEVTNQALGSDPYANPAGLLYGLTVTGNTEVNCTQVPVIYDACLNIPEIQQSIPEGYERQGESDCVRKTSGGGGGGGCRNCNDDDDDDRETPPGDVEGASDSKEQVKVVPTVAGANTGAGGSQAPLSTIPLMALVAMIASLAVMRRTSDAR
jgi:hypothetical protein